MRKILLPVVFSLLWLTTVAQTAKRTTDTTPAATQAPKNTISGTVVDAAREGVVGAVLELIPLRDTTQKKYTTSAIRGAFQFKSVAAGEYRLRASSLGYKDSTQHITMTNRAGVTLPEWVLDEDTKRIDAVSVTALAVRTTINGDTIVYNAAAYKVLPDADAEELLAKMPGITVNGGTVEAQGETVQKVLVDGREFFGNDVATALKTLPAEAIKSVEVFDKLSDQAEFSGIDDGNSYKAINIVTHNKMKTAVFGRVNAQYAFEPRTEESTRHYGSTDGNFNFFREKSKTTLRFAANNMNGNSQSRMAFGGLNYINSWGQNDKVKLEGSYSYNTSNNRSYSWVQRDYFLTEEELNSGAADIYSRYISNSNSQSRGNNHNLNVRFEDRISQRQRLMMRAQVSFNDNRSSGNSASDYYPISSLDANDFITLANWNLGNSDAVNAGLNGNYFLRLGEKAGRTLFVNVDANYSTNNSGNENYSERTTDNSVQQKSRSDNYNYNVGGGVTYAEPIGTHAQVTLGYNASYRYTNADRLTNLYNFETGEYEEFISPEYSNRNHTDYLTHRVGPGFRYGKEGTSVSGQLNFQSVTMNSDREYPAVYTLPEKTFNNLTYSIMSRIKLDMQNRLSLRINSSTSNPSVNQLQDVVDISNVNNIYAGNPHLRPSYAHRANLGYNHSGIMRGTTFAVNLGGSMNRNQIVDSVVMNQPGYEVFSPDGELLTVLSGTGQFRKPVNLENGGDNGWNVNGSISYGFPVKLIGCNINIEGNTSFSQSPSILNGVINRSHEFRAGGGISVGSNFSQYVDFRLSYRPSYNKVTNTMSNNGNNEYMRHAASANINVVFGFGLTLRANANYSQYVGLTANNRNMDNSEFICNFGMGMKVLKKMGEVQLIANDVFNQNKGYGRSWNALYMQNSRSSVIGRFFGIKFSYNLRRYGQTRKGEVIGDRSSGGDFRPMEGGSGRPGGGMGAPGGGMGGPGSGVYRGGF